MGVRDYWRYCGSMCGLSTVRQEFQPRSQLGPMPHHRSDTGHVDSQVNRTINQGRWNAARRFEQSPSPTRRQNFASTKFCRQVSSMRPATALPIRSTGRPAALSQVPARILAARRIPGTGSAKSKANSRRQGNGLGIRGGNHFRHLFLQQLFANHLGRPFWFGNYRKELAGYYRGDGNLRSCSL